jgi:hypothetical protein
MSDDRLLRDQHGTRQCYASGCRRPECIEANAEYMREYRAGRRIGRKPRPKKKPEHGTRSAYVAGCVCEKCTEANREYQRMYMSLRRRGIPWNDPHIEGFLT